AGQDHVGVAGRFRQKEVNDTQKLDLLERLTGEVRVGQGDQRIEADRKQPLDLAAVNGFHDLDGSVTGLGDLIGMDSPHLRYVPPRLGVLERTLAGKLIAFLSVLAAALAVTLPRDHGASGALAADIAGGKAEVDQSLAVLNSLGMVLDASGVHGDGAICFREPPGRAL